MSYGAPWRFLLSLLCAINESSVLQHKDFGAEVVNHYSVLKLDVNETFEGW